MYDNMHAIKSYLNIVQNDVALLKSIQQSKSEDIPIETAKKSIHDDNNSIVSKTPDESTTIGQEIRMLVMTNLLEL